MRGCSLKRLKSLGDARGSLNVVEALKDIPFEIKRIFYEYAHSGDHSRGNHANRNSRFAFISVAGSCKIDADNATEREEFLLNTPSDILIMDSMVWKSLKDLSADNVLLVLSDCYYDGGEYIKDYEEFKKNVLNKGTL